MLVVVPDDYSGVTPPLLVGVLIAIDDDVAGFCRFGLGGESDVGQER